MKKLFITLFIGYLAFNFPLQAGPGFKIKKLPAPLAKVRRAIVKPVGVNEKQLEQAIIRASVKNNRTPVVAGTEKAMIPLKEPASFRLPGTAFLIEEIYQGKKQLWGVFATHYGYERPSIPKTRFSHTPLTFRAQGNKSSNDVSIFSIPEELADTFQPLKLADKAPQIGEELFSLSFFDKQFQYTPNRKVLEVTPQRIIVSGRFDPEICREGECGSPLINQKGEVVGMIVGASYSRQIGYAVPVENIHDILKAFHHQGRLYKRVLLNGKEIMQLNVNEAIVRIRVKRQDNSVISRLTHHNEKDLDFAHLETFMDFSQAQEVTLVIEKTPFSPQTTDQQRHIRHVVYNLQTGQSQIFPID